MGCSRKVKFWKSCSSLFALSAIYAIVVQGGIREAGEVEFFAAFFYEVSNLHWVFL